MSQLPKGWVGCKLGDVVDYGKTVKADMTNIDDDAWVLELEDLEKDSSKILQRVSFGERKPKSAKNAFKAGDVLYGKLRPYLNKMVVAPEDGICTSEIIPLKVPTGLVDNRYLFYWLKGRIFGDYVNAVSYGVNMPRLGTKDGLNAPMVLAPTAEQTRIVEKLDEVLAQVDTIKARLDGIPAILKRFRQSVLAAAVSGKLTEEWRKNNSGQQIKPLIWEIETQREKLKAAKLLKRNFGKHETVEPLSNELPDGWEWVCFDQISDNENNALKAGPFGSALKKSDCTDHGYRVYGQEQVIAGDETLVSYYINEEKYQQLEACSVKPGDILISLVGTIGKVLILSDNVESGIINPRLVKLSLNSEVQRKYIKAYLDSPLAWQFFKGFSHGGTMDILNLGILRKLPIALPPVEEQREIVRLVDQYFAFADTIEAQVKKAQARVDKLTQSILAKAFRGELVAQDPNDEPADKLLERIAAARAEAETLAKTVKKAGRKVKATS
ncbi:restriction endonuclease subunit S [Shewanella algae]|uniref:restriction endonuclease subunit S n=1 Tax=Shewanella algae TaxID=38313 RepID=UPI0031F563F2